MQNQNGPSNLKYTRIFGRQLFSTKLCLRAQPSKPAQQLPVTLSVGPRDFEIFSEDFEKCYHAFPIENGKAELDQDGLIHIMYTRAVQGQPQNFDFLMKFDRFDLINSLFKQTSKAPSENLQMTITPYKDILTLACDSKTAQDLDTFTAHLTAQARRRLIFLSSSKTPPTQNLLAALAIEFRLRFPQIEIENWTEAFEVLWFEFVAFCVSLWTECLKTVIEPHSGPNSEEYFRRLSASIAALIAKGADEFQVDRREFLIAVRKFIDSGDPSDIPAASRSIVSDVELALGNIRKRWLLQLTDLFEYSQIFSVSICIAHAIAPEEVKNEIKTVSDVLGSWIYSYVNNMTRGPKMNDFKNGLDKLAVSLLRTTDKDRYGPDFHCTLALWKLCELARATD